MGKQWHNPWGQGRDTDPNRTTSGWPLQHLLGAGGRALWGCHHLLERLSSHRSGGDPSYVAPHCKEALRPLTTAQLELPGSGRHSCSTAKGQSCSLRHPKVPHWLQSAAAGLNTSHTARACGATHPSPLPAPQIPHGARHEEVTHWLSELQNGETQVWTGVQAQGQHPPMPPSPAQRGLPLVLAMENHAVLQWLYPGLQLLHLPSLPAHTSPTKALSHQLVFSSTAGLDSAHAAPSPGLRHREHELLSLGELSSTPKEPLDPLFCLPPHH